MEIDGFTGEKVDPTKKDFRYRHLAEEIEKKILSGIYQPGERLPSIRKMHKQSNLSISTIYHAYMELESMGLGGKTEIWLLCEPSCSAEFKSTAIQDDNLTFLGGKDIFLN